MLGSKCDMVTAVSGTDGLALIRNQGPFAVVRSDVRMARMDGVQFLRSVRQLAPNTVRLLLTGQIDFKGAVDAVTPICPNALHLRLLRGKADPTSAVLVPIWTVSA